MLVVLVNLLLVSPALMPAFSQVNPHDEAKYVESGRFLTKMEIQVLAWGPAVALVYAPLHVFLGNSPDWFLLEVWAGRGLLFLSLLLSTLYLAHQLRPLTHVFAAAAVLFVSGCFLEVVKNPSDALFAILSSLSLAQFLRFDREGSVRHLQLASVLAGLATLSRFEGVLLVGVLGGISLVRGRSRKALLRGFLSSVLPAGAVLGVYLISHGLTAGNFQLGVSGKAYDAFEQTQSLLDRGSFTGGVEQVRVTFGTPGGNGGSVLRAALRNPSAFGQRLVATALTIPDSYHAVFGKKLGPVLLIFASWGIYALLRRRGTGPLALILLWSLPSVVSLILAFHHLIPQTALLVLVLSIVGLTDAFRNDVSRRERAVLLGLALGLATYGLVDAKPAFLPAGLILAAAVALAWLLSSSLYAVSDLRSTSLLLMVSAGLILRGPFQFPNYPHVGRSAEERAVHYLEHALPEGSRVLVPFPLPAVAARMTDVDMGDPGSEFKNPEEFWRWLRQEDIRAIYLDDRYSIRPDLTLLIKKGIGLYFEVGFAPAEGDPKVLLVRPDPSVPGP